MVTSVTSSTTSTAANTLSTNNLTTNAANASTAKAAAQALVTSLGTGSGVDVNSLANALANAEIDPQKSIIQGKIDKSNATISGFAAVKYVLGNLQTAFADLKDKSDYSSITASNSQPNAFGVTTGAAASTGGHSVLVSSIAKSQRTLGLGFADKTSPISASQFKLFISVHGGQATEVTVPSNGTPQDMVTAINSWTTTTGVKAQIVNTGGTTPWHIMLTGATGVANDFTISSNLSAPAAPTAPNVTTTQGDPDLSITESSTISFANGLAPGESVTLAGLTFTANKELTSTQVASAFTNLAAGATGKDGINFGAYSGSLAGYSTGSANVAGTGLTATSTTANTNVADISVQTGAAADYFKWSTLQSAADASLTVDGMNITSPTNTVKDAVAGVTLELYGTTSGADGALLNLNRETSGVKTKIEALVSAYNDAISMLGVVSDPKSTVETYGATLVGNATVNNIRSQVRAMVTDPSNADSGSLTALRDLGVSLDRYGKLQIDNTKLDGALQANFDDVVTVLSNNQENQGKYNHSHAGIAGEAYKKIDLMLDPNNGQLSTLSNNQTKKIASYQKQLDDLNNRLQQILDRYIKQFSAMDSLVGQIKSTQSSLKNTFAGMMASYTNKG